MKSRSYKLLRLTSILLILSLISCKRILVETLIKDRSAIKKMKILENEDRQIVYIPMVHVGSEKYYQEIKEFLEEKRSDGYTVYYEGLKYGPGLDSSGKVKLDLKLRHLLGIHLTDLENRDNKSLPGYVRNNRNAFQSKEIIGIDTTKDVHADLTRQEVVDLYEMEYGKIHLDSCDINTPLLDEYECSKGVAYYKVVFTYRDEALIQKLLNNEHYKIVLVFGKSHWIKSIYPKLVNKNGYKLIHGKI